MFKALLSFIDRRKAIRRRWEADATILIARNERSAYYDAQRLAWKGRCKGERPEYWHWAKVASEVARRSPIAEMELSVVDAIAAEECVAAAAVERTHQQQPTASSDPGSSYPSARRARRSHRTRS